MRPALGLILLGLVAALVAAAAPPPGNPPVTLAASAPSAALAIASDRALVGRGDQLNLTLWLNVTGNGQFQQTLVNLSLATASVPAENSLLQSGVWTQPGGCGYLVASNWFFEWECVGLRAGSYVWKVPAVVPSNATVGHYQRVDASAFSTVGSGNVSANANETVWIAGAVLRILDIDSLPAESVRPGQIVQYWINVSNDALANEWDVNGTGTAFNVSVVVHLGAGLHPGARSANLTTNLTSLPPSAVLSVNLEAIVAQNVTPGTTVGIQVLLTYQDFNRHGIGPMEAGSTPLYVVQSNLLSTANLLAGAVIGLAAILTSLMVLLYVGQRKIQIDEVFLMTKGGILIRHASREPELRKDDDIVASMFVAIQEFVRDSFRREAALDSVAFGRRHAAVVRGELTVLAAVISHGDADSVTPELLAAVRSLEARYWTVLVAWDGNLSRLEGADEVLAQLMRGKFRAPWRVKLT